MLYRVGCLLFAVTLLATNAWSDELDGLRAAIDAAERSHICPSGGEKPILENNRFCERYCKASLACEGTKETDPCYRGDREECKKQAEGSSQCLREMNEKNKVIIEFNSLLRK